MPHPPTRVSQRLFWRAIRAGLTSAGAAESIGVSATFGKRWFRESGGMPPLPLDLPDMPSRYLDLDERVVIHAGLLLGHSCAEIARQLGRSTSTVTRELELHKLDPVRPKAGPMPLGRDGRRKIPKKLNCSPTAAQGRAEAGRRRPKTGKLAPCPRLREEVHDLSVHDPEELAFVAAEINDRPRKVLGWRTPREVFYETLRAA